MDETPVTIMSFDTSEEIASMSVSNADSQVDANPMLDFISPKDQSSYIKVIGVGGGGSNAVNHMYRQGIQGVDFIVCNTDRKALNSSPVPTKIVLGELGAGGRPEVGRKAALEHKAEIAEVLSHNTQMLFITAGMGGGTGTGAAPVIAEIAKGIKVEDEDIDHILVVAIVTFPFSFELKNKRMLAQQGLENLKKHVDSIIVIYNDKLREYGNMPLHDAFKLADNVLLTAAKGIAEIITVSAYVNIDFHDVYTIMRESGTALMGSGRGSGENRAAAAIKAATESPLLNDTSIVGAKGVLLYISYSDQNPATMDEFGEITDYVNRITDEDNAQVIWGDGIDNSLGDDISVTLIATGFDGEHRVVHAIDDSGKSSNPEPPQDNNPVAPESPGSGKKIVLTLDRDDAADTTSQSPIPEEEAKPVVTNQETEADESLEPHLVSKTPETSQPIWSRPMPIENEAVKVESPVVTKVEIPVVADNQQLNNSIAHSSTTQQLNNSTIQQLNTTSMVDVVAAPPETEDTASKNSDAMLRNLRTLDRMSRIKKLHDVLRQNPDGAKMIESVMPSELTGELVLENVGSASQSTVRRDGGMTDVNSFLYKPAD